MKCYFDGSRTKDSDGHSWLTLAGYVARDAFWPKFNRSWKSEVLEKREPHATFLHTVDVVQGNGAFAGWEQERRNKLVIDANLYLQSLPKMALCLLVCSIDETARDAIAAEGHKIRESPDICGYLCIMNAFKWYYEAWPDNLEIAHIYFDQGEQFLHPFRQRWLRENKGQKLIVTNTFWGGIAEVEALNSKQTPGLQAADLSAWAISRERSSSVDRAQRHLAKIQGMIIPNWRIVLDEAVLRRKHCSPEEPEE